MSVHAKSREIDTWFLRIGMETPRIEHYESIGPAEQQFTVRTGIAGTHIIRSAPVGNIYSGTPYLPVFLAVAEQAGVGTHPQIAGRCVFQDTENHAVHEIAVRIGIEIRIGTVRRQPVHIATAGAEPYARRHCPAETADVVRRMRIVLKIMPTYQFSRGRIQDIYAVMGHEPEITGSIVVQCLHSQPYLMPRVIMKNHVFHLSGPAVPEHQFRIRIGKPESFIPLRFEVIYREKLTRTGIVNRQSRDLAGIHVNGADTAIESCRIHQVPIRAQPLYHAGRQRLVTASSLLPSGE